MLSQDGTWNILCTAKIDASDAYVGTVSEIGLYITVSSSGLAMGTHALIKDAEGNPTDRYVYDNIPAFTRICDLCADRQEKGKLPSCVFHCQAKCMEFGPVDELAKKLAEKPEQYLWVPANA